MSKLSPNRPAISSKYEMTPKRHGFLNSLRRAFHVMIAGRYLAGQEEHGGDLWLKATYPMLGAELIDAYTYYQTHRVRMQQWLQLLLDNRARTEAGVDLEGVDVVIRELKAELSVIETTTEILTCPSDDALYP